MRRSFGFLRHTAVACACALAAASPGCDLTNYAQATGYVRAADTFEPRRLDVEFTSANDIVAAQAVVDLVSTDATVLTFDAGPPRVGVVETPLGYSLDEMITDLEALAGVVSAAQDPLPYPGAPTGYLLMSEDGMREVAWLREGGVVLSPLEYEFVVRVEGTHDALAGTDVGVLNIESVTAAGDRVVQKGGTITLVDRSGDGLGTKVVLVDDLREKAWEIVGDSALVSEIIALGDGALVSVTGTELAPGLTSYAGGLSLSVVSYDELTTTEVNDIRTLVGTALPNLGPAPDSGDEVWFLPIELTEGAVASVPAELDLFAAASTISENGYLVFVDYDDPTPPSQIVFVKTALPAEPVVLFSGHPLTSLKVTDAAGEVVTGPWVSYY